MEKQRCPVNKRLKLTSRIMQIISKIEISTSQPNEEANECLSECKLDETKFKNEERKKAIITGQKSTYTTTIGAKQIIQTIYNENKYQHRIYKAEKLTRQFNCTNLSTQTATNKNNNNQKKAAVSPSIYPASSCATQRAPPRDRERRSPLAAAAAAAAGARERRLRRAFADERRCDCCCRRQRLQRRPPPRPSIVGGERALRQQRRRQNVAAASAAAAAADAAAAARHSRCRQYTAASRKAAASSSPLRRAFADLSCSLRRLQAADREARPMAAPFVVTACSMR